MDITYRGYTIIPSSERQPDGRWLPVAELEVSYRGVVTPQPPLRATTREMRATRADADAAAVKMARAWIDASEREGTTTPASTPTASDMGSSPRVPIGTEVPSPRTRQETRAQERQEARGDAAPRVKAAGDKRRSTRFGELNWADLYQTLGFDSGEKVDRLTRVLVVHFLLDRLVTLVLATKFASSRESTKAPDVGKALMDIASLPLPVRVDLASMLGVVAPRVAEGILEVHRVRNGLVHLEPTPGKPAWDVSAADEITAQEACDQGLHRGIEAVQDLMSALSVKVKET
jgi:hypothetical protein